MKISIEIENDSVVIGTRIKNAHMYERPDVEEQALVIQSLREEIVKLQSENKKIKREGFVSDSHIEALLSGLLSIEKDAGLINKDSVVRRLRELHEAHTDYKKEILYE